MDITKLSAAKIEALREKRDAIDSAVGTAAIAAGMGNWRPSDRDAALAGDRPASPEELAICRDWKAAADARWEVIAEMEARRRWHGSLKPIKR